MLKISGYVFTAIAIVLIGLKIYQSEIPDETSAVSQQFSQQEITSIPGVAPAFPGLSGPQETTILPGAPSPTSIDRYRSGGENVLGILLRNTDSSWLGIAHGLKSMGVPFKITTDPATALSHEVVLVYPSVTGSNTEPAILRQFAEHVRAGKTLIAFSVIGGGLPEVFGFESSIEISNQQELRFQENELTDTIITEPVEAIMQLAPLNDASAGLPGISFTNPKHSPLATYADGSAAITYNFFQSSGSVGYAYAVGFDFGHYILRAHNGRFASRSENYVNAYQPTIDTFLRLIARIYQQGEPDAVLLMPTPNNKAFTVLMTHDIDYTQSINNAVDYASYEKDQGIPSTYFIQTKYVKDYNDDLFFEASRKDLFDRLKSFEVEIASHTVAHSNEFRSMPLGSGNEKYPQYQPFVFDFETVRNASIVGELRVSKYLLQQVFGQPVKSFRPGHLSLPQALPQMLVATGYRYSSSITANEALTHLPYQLMHDRGYNAEVSAYEFPVTIEDEQGSLAERLDDSINLARKIGRYGGVVNVLIHTDITGEKLRFEQQFVEQLRPEAWFADMGSFGDWWAIRDNTSLSVVEETNGIKTLEISTGGVIDGLTLHVPASWQYTSGLEGTVQDDNRVVMGQVDDQASLRFEVLQGR